MKRIKGLLLIIPCLLLLFGCGKKKYDIAFVDFDNSLLYETKVKEGEYPTYPFNNPTRSDDEDYSYEFSGWNPKVEVATENATYTATYSKKEHVYTLTTNMNYDGAGIITKYDNTIIDKGEQVILNAQIDYAVSKSFLGWYNGEELLSNNLEYIFVMPKHSMVIEARFDFIVEMDKFYFETNGNECEITGIKDKSATSIVVPNCVTSIAEGSFSGCSSLEEITIPFVGDRKQASMTDATQYPLGYIFGTPNNSGVGISQYHYEDGNEKYTRYDIPRSLKKVIITESNYIQCGAFSYCSNLTSITIPNSVTNIGSKAFLYCKCEIIWGDNPSIKAISDSLFRLYEGTNLEIPNSVTSIEHEAFDQCTNLISITIPNSVSSIGNYAFWDFDDYLNQASVYYDGTIENWCNISFADQWSNPMLKAANLYILDRNGNVEYNGKKYNLVTEITIPNSITSIGNYVFHYWSNLTSITIPNSVTSIGRLAFCECSSLQDVYFNGTIIEWCNILFYDESSNPMYYASNFYVLDENGDVEYNGLNYTLITELTIPNSITSIGAYAFSGCTYEIVWEDNPGITKIGNYAFCGYKGTSITIPNSITSIGIRAFSDCTSEIIWEDNPKITVIDYYAFERYKGTSITIPNSVTTIRDQAFRECTNLTSITIPNSVTAIGRQTFEQCTNLTSITIPNGVKYIWGKAFKDCTNLTSITIPNSVNNIGYGAFYNCSNLTSVYFVGTQTEWQTISIEEYNTPLNDETIFYYSEIEPSESGNYWHYDGSNRIIRW